MGLFSQRCPLSEESFFLFEDRQASDLSHAMEAPMPSPFNHDRLKAKKGMRNRPGDNPLHRAIRKRDLESIHFYLRNLPQMGWRLASQKNGDGFTPVHLAALIGDRELLSLLTRDGRYLSEERDREGRSPLHLAIVQDSVVAVELFAEGLTPAQYAPLFDHSGLTPFHTAIHHNRVKILTILLKGCDPHYLDIRALDAQKRTPLQEAAALGRLELVKLLVLAGATLEANDREGLNAYQLADKYGHKEVAEFLNKAMHIETQWLCLCDIRERMQLMGFNAARRYLYRFLSRGGNLNGINFRGLTGLHQAVLAKEVSIIELLTEFDTLELLKRAEGEFQSYTALHLAVLSGDSRVIEALLKRESSQTMRRLMRSATLKDGRTTPAMLAKELGFKELGSLLS